MLPRNPFGPGSPILPYRKRKQSSKFIHWPTECLISYILYTVFWSFWIINDAIWLAGTFLVPCAGFQIWKKNNFWTLWLSELFFQLMLTKWVNQQIIEKDLWLVVGRGSMVAISDLVTLTNKNNLKASLTKWHLYLFCSWKKKKNNNSPLALQFHVVLCFPPYLPVPKRTDHRWKTENVPYI